MINTHPYTYSGLITKITDGDTVKIDIALGFGILLEDQVFRLYGINTPELKDKDPLVKKSAIEAKEFLRSLLLNKEVRIQTIKDKKEKYGRYLAKIWVEQDGQEVLVNKIMVDKGFAKEAYYGNNESDG
jgi:micrococcal nuclease